MSNNSVYISEISRAGYDVESKRVVLMTQTPGGPLNIEFPKELLNRLIALTLQLAGKVSKFEPEDVTALVPEGYELCSLADDRLGLRIILPGGAPLTFALASQDAEALAADIASHTLLTSSSTRQ